jgi:hypothetical protein
MKKTEAIKVDESSQEWLQLKKQKSVAWSFEY